MSGLKRRHVLDLDDFAPEEITRVLDTMSLDELTSADVPELFTIRA